MRIALTLCTILALIFIANASREKTTMPNEMIQPETEPPGNLKQAMFGAGCFWGIEHSFRQIEGVHDSVSGYSGGHKDEPTYREVCTGRTGHAEVVHVTYDPEKVSYDQLLDHFWSIHDPTQLNRQGPDVGSQYRSAIFTYGAEQQAAAEASRDRHQATPKFANRRIVTEIAPASTFWRAEEYHQRYLEKNGYAACPTTGL